MPPKGRGIAAKAKAKAKPKARPRVRPARQRPAARERAVGLRRPAVAGEEPEGKQELRWSDLSVADLGKEGLLLFEGNYWDSSAVFAGKITGYQSVGEEKYLKVKVGGTKHEGLLKYLSSRTDKEVQVHLCPSPCTTRTWRDGLVHLDKLFKLVGAEEAWMSNAVEVPRRDQDNNEDEMGDLRREMENVEAKTPRRESRSVSRKREVKKKKKKVAKRGRSKEKEEKSRKIRPKKKAADLFETTGMDPDPKVRQRLLKRGRRIAAKKKKAKARQSSSDGSSTEKSATSSSTEDVEMQALGRKGLFSETSVVRKMATELPGVLAADWMEECQQYLLDSQGMVWNQGTGPIQPLAVQFYRSQMSQRLSGPMAREYQTLCYMMDLLAQARPSEAMDVACQRLKSLASSGSGVHYTISQRMEILPAEKTLPASLNETQEAAKAAREEEKVYSLAARNSRGWIPGGGKEGPKEGKGKEGKGKKGKGKEGKGKEDQRTGLAEGKKG
eukprot:s30_g32.t1